MDHNHSNELSKEEFNTALDVLLGCFNLHFSAAEKILGPKKYAFLLRSLVRPCK